MELENILVMRLIDKSFRNFWTLRSLRNGDRQWFVNNERISLWKHLKWWRKYWKANTCLFFEILSKGKLAGYISRTRVGDRQYELGNLMLKKGFNGKGIMSWALKTLSDDPYSIFYGTIIEGNDKSRNCFIRAGFKKQGYIMKNAKFLTIWMKGKAWDENQNSIVE